MLNNNKKKKDFGFIINPVSGQGNGKKLFEEISYILKDKGILSDSFTCYYTTGLSEDDINISNIVDNSNKICVAGGDGTISKIIEAIMNSIHKPPVALIPMGTGNDLARVIGTKKVLEKEGVSGIIDLMFTENITKFDIWSINNGAKLMSNYLSIGFDAAAIETLNSIREKRGKAGSTVLENKFLVFLGGLLSIKYKFTEGEAIINPLDDSNCPSFNLKGNKSIIFSNIWSYGGGNCIAPGAKEGDGMLHVTSIKSFAQFLLLFILKPFSVIKGSYVKFVEQTQCSFAEVSFRKGEPVQVDGESCNDLSVNGKIKIEHLGKMDFFFNELKKF